MEIYFSKYDTILISLHAASFSRVVPVTTNIDFHHLFGVNFLSFDNPDCLWMCLFYSVELLTIYD